MTHLPLRVHDQHLESVLDVGETDVRVVVQRKDLGVRIELLQLLCDASADHVVGQTAEGLEDDEVPAAICCVVQDLTRDQNAFAGIGSLFLTSSCMRAARL